MTRDTGLADWYASEGRHALPWRATRDPWLILVSEVMLQQTPVGRVLPRWEEFVTRWPAPEACAAAPLADILRAWQGLGYPRRARALHRTASMVAGGGWPETELELRVLPGVGAYTARALRCFAFDAPDVPRDVNVGRIVARAVCGAEAHEVPPRVLEGAIRDVIPRGLAPRDQAYALFDLGATVCVAQAPRCQSCPLEPSCLSTARLRTSPPPRHPRRQARFEGSARQVRGAILRLSLQPKPPLSPLELVTQLASAGVIRTQEEVAAGVAGLVADGLLDEGTWGPFERLSEPDPGTSGRSSPPPRRRTAISPGGDAATASQRGRRRAQFRPARLRSDS